MIIMQISQDNLLKLQNATFEANLKMLINYFSTPNDLNALEKAIGSKTFNDLRSHILACKIDQEKYLKLLSDDTRNNLVQEASLAIHFIN